MATPSLATEEENMDRKRDIGLETFDSPGDLRHWLTREQKFVCLTGERRIKEATDLVEAYEAGKLTPDEAKNKFYAYARRWPNSLCFDEALEIEIETEVTGFEPNPTGETPYRPCKQKVGALPRHGHH